LANRSRLKAWRDAIVALKDRMQREIAAGKTADEVVAAKISEPYAKEFPMGHERFIRILHQELSRR
jgi:hypothetical protein